VQGFVRPPGFPSDLLEQGIALFAGRQVLRFLSKTLGFTTIEEWQQIFEATALHGLAPMSGLPSKKTL
jgi:hypothetical protein